MYISPSESRCLALTSSSGSTRKGPLCTVHQRAQHSKRWGVPDDVLIRQAGRAADRGLVGPAAAAAEWARRVCGVAAGAGWRRAQDAGPVLQQPPGGRRRCGRDAGAAGGALEGPAWPGVCQAVGFSMRAPVKAGMYSQHGPSGGQAMSNRRHAQAGTAWSGAQMQLARCCTTTRQP